MADGDLPLLSRPTEKGVHESSQNSYNRSNPNSTYATILSCHTKVDTSKVIHRPQASSSISNSTAHDPAPAQITNSDVDFEELKYPVLIQGTPTILFDVSEQSTLVSKFKYALIGKFSHGKPSWKKVIDFFDLLKLKGTCKVSIFDHKHLYIVCSNKIDFNRLWLRLVWSIDGYAMRIFKWEPNFNAQKESSIAPVWIRLEGLPLYMFDKMPLLNVSNAIGKPICIDPRNLNGSMLNSAKVCVELDVSKPLIDTIKIGIVHNDSKVLVEELSVQVYYDVVPPFCHSCWHLGHGKDMCKRSTASPVVADSYSGPKRPGKEMAESSQVPLAAPSNSHQAGNQMGHAGSKEWRVIVRKKDEVHFDRKKTWVTKATEEPIKMAITHADPSHSVTVANRFVALSDESSHQINLQQLPLARLNADQEATHLEFIAAVSTNKPVHSDGALILECLQAFDDVNAVAGASETRQKMQTNLESNAREEKVDEELQVETESGVLQPIVSTYKELHSSADKINLGLVGVSTAAIEKFSKVENAKDTEVGKSNSGLQLGATSDDWAIVVWEGPSVEQSTTVIEAATAKDTNDVELQENKRAKTEQNSGQDHSLQRSQTKALRLSWADQGEDEEIGHKQADSRITIRNDNDIATGRIKMISDDLLKAQNEAATHQKGSIMRVYKNNLSFHISDIHTMEQKYSSAEFLLASFYKKHINKAIEEEMKKDTAKEAKDPTSEQDWQIVSSKKKTRAKDNIIYKEDPLSWNSKNKQALEHERVVNKEPRAYKTNPTENVDTRMASLRARINKMRRDSPAKRKLQAELKVLLGNLG